MDEDRTVIVGIRDADGEFIPFADDVYEEVEKLKKKKALPTGESTEN